MKTLKIGIADYGRMKARTLEIARGEYGPTKGGPTVWFTSIESFAKALSERNRELLALIAREQPHSPTRPVARAEPGLKQSTDRVAACYPRQPSDDQTRRDA